MQYLSKIKLSFISSEFHFQNKTSNNSIECSRQNWDEIKFILKCWTSVRKCSIIRLKDFELEIIDDYFWFLGRKTKKFNRTFFKLNDRSDIRWAIVHIQDYVGNSFIKFVFTSKLAGTLFSHILYGQRPIGHFWKWTHQSIFYF